MVEFVTIFLNIFWNWVESSNSTLILSIFKKLVINSASVGKLTVKEQVTPNELATKSERRGLRAKRTGERAVYLLLPGFYICEECRGMDFSENILHWTLTCRTIKPLLFNIITDYKNCIEHIAHRNPEELSGQTFFHPSFSHFMRWLTITSLCKICVLQLTNTCYLYVYTLLTNGRLFG